MQQQLIEHITLRVRAAKLHFMQRLANRVQLLEARVEVIVCVGGHCFEAPRTQTLVNTNVVLDKQGVAIGKQVFSQRFVRLHCVALAVQEFVQTVEKSAHVLLASGSNVAHCKMHVAVQSHVLVGVLCANFTKFLPTITNIVTCIMKVTRYSFPVQVAV